LPARSYRLRRVARLAAALLDRMGHAQADVLGVSGAARRRSSSRAASARAAVASSCAPPRRAW